MENWQSQNILNNLRDLTEYIRCSSLFVAELTSKNILSIADNAALNAEPNRLEKSKYLLDVLLTQKDGYIGLLKALHETTQTGARDILLIGVLHNLKLKISSKLSHLKEYFTENETKQFYLQLSSSQFDELYSCLIAFLESDKPFQIMKQTIPEQISYYIPRIICKRLRLHPEIFVQSCPDIFVVTGSDRNTLRNLAGKNKTAYSSDQLDEITAQIIVLEDKGDWVELQDRNSNQYLIHLIEYETDKNRFILKESNGNSDIIRRFLDTDREAYDVTIKEEQFMSEVEKEKCKGVCICDLPGMGKTFLIGNLARKAEQEGKSIVAFIRLQHFTQTVYKSVQSESPELILLQYLACSDLCVCILRKIIEVNKLKIDIYFDGFDETQDVYVQWTEIFLKSLTYQENIRIFVTSRPHMRDKLQEILGVIAYDILPFNQINQIDFFTNFWLSQHPKQDSIKLKQFANICFKEFSKNIPQDECDIAGIPLICFLIAEIYAKYASRYARKNAHLNESWVSFGKSMFDIYKMYIEAKFESKKVLNTLSFSEVTSVKKEHYKRALIQIFPDHAQNLVGNVHVEDGEVDKSLFSYGLLHKINIADKNVYQFIHRTIAEFFVAEYIVNQLAQLNGDSQINTNTSANSPSFNGQIKEFIVFLFQIVLTSQKDKNSGAMSVAFTKGMIPRTYYFSFTASTTMYFMDSQLKQTTLSANMDSIVMHHIITTSTRINITQMIECCGYQNLRNVFCFIENIVKGNPKKHQISLECLCETITVIFQFSNFEFVKTCVEFVGSYFNVSLKDVARVCTENHWLTPLQYACYRKSYDLLDYLLEEFCSTEDQFLIHFCVASFKRGIRNTHIRIDMIERLISINPKLIFERDVQNGTPLFHTGIDSQLVKFLIAKGSDVLATDEFGDTLAHNCVYSNTKIPDDDLKTLLKFLIDDCKAIESFKIKNKAGNTPIHDALRCWENLCVDTLKSMLSKTKMNVNDKNKNGDALLSAAIEGRQSIEILNLLVELGANLEVINNNGENLVHVAALSGNVETVKFLLSLGLDPSHESNSGKTPLQLVINENPLCCRLEIASCRHKEIIPVSQNLKSSNS